MTERQLEMLNNDFRYLAGIVHSQTTDKTLLATKLAYHAKKSNKFA